MNIKEHRNQLETLEYFLKEIELREKVIIEMTKSEKNKSNLFYSFFSFFKLNTKQTTTMCIDGLFYDLDIDNDLRNECIQAFIKSKERLEKIYRETKQMFSNDENKIKNK